MSLPSIVVLKFGGTSVASPERRELAAAHVLRRVHEGKNVVVVVSAMGRCGDPYATDTLLDLVKPYPACPVRERDALAACGEEIAAPVFAALLTERGVKAVSLRGFQAGFVTDDRFGDATVQEVRPARILAHLRRGEVVVVTGFQGITAAGDVTTIGRGGSDTSAVVLGVALQAEHVEIFTDVDGVLTADPRVVPEALSLPGVTFEESAELAYKGSKVLHPAAAEYARASGTNVVVRNTNTEAEGTWIVPDTERYRFVDDATRFASSITSKAGIAQFAVTGVDFRAELPRLERVFGVVAEAGVSLDMMSILCDRVLFTTDRANVGVVSASLAGLGVTFTVMNACAKVTLVGGGIHGVPGIMHRMVRALTGAGIAVLQSVDSNMIVGVLVDAARVDDAVRAVHAEFFGPAR
jgi:aspartate kinase